MLIEKMVLKTEDGQTFRLLKLTSDGGILVPCNKYGLPFRQPIDILRHYKESVLPENEMMLLSEEDFPDWKKEVRDWRWSLIQEIVDEQYLVDARKRRILIKEAANKGQCSTKTINKYLWLYWVYQTPNALIPQDKGKRNTIQVSHQDEDSYDKVFRWALNRFYYTPQKQTLEMAYRLMLKAKFCDANGMLQPPYPSYWQFRYYFRQHRNHITEIISREGLTEYQRNYRPFTGSVQTYTRNIGIFMTDATEADVYIVSRLSRKPVGRPIVYTMVDAYSQLITGVHVGLEGGTHALRLLLLNTCSDKVKYCRQFGYSITTDMWPASHLPQKIITDRGNEFTSGVMANLCAAYGIEVDTLPAYRPDLKGPVEKLFDILQNTYKPLLKGKGVIEPDFQKRGAKDYRRQGVLDIEQFTQVLLRCVVHYNTQTILGSFVRPPEMVEQDIPAIPASIWNYCLPNYIGKERRVDIDVLKRVLLPRTDARITQKGLVAFGLSYINPEFKERFVSAGIMGTVCVRIAYDSNNLDIIWLVEKEQFIPFELATEQYRGRTLQEVIDLKQQEKAMRDEFSLKTLQADIDLIAEIQDIVHTASAETANISSNQIGELVKAERQVEKKRLRKNASSEPEEDESDMLSILKKQQKEAFDL